MMILPVLNELYIRSLKKGNQTLTTEVFTQIYEEIRREEVNAQYRAHMTAVRIGLGAFILGFATCAIILYLV